MNDAYNSPLKKIPMSFIQSEWFWGYASALGAWLFSILLPINSFLIFTIVLVFFDLISGRQAAKVRGEEIRSRGYKRTVEKIVLYFVAILAAEGMRLVFMKSVPLAYLAAFAIALTEFKSIVENVETVTGVNVWSFIKDHLKLPKEKGGN